MARNTVRMTVDTSKADKKLKRLADDIERDAALTTQEVGNKGKQYARSIAPYYSGATFRNIILKRGKDKTEVIVMAQNPTASDGHSRGQQSTKYSTRGRFNLVKWMHESPSALTHIHSGDPRFMDATYIYLEKIAPQTMRERLDKIIVKTNNR